MLHFSITYLTVQLPRECSDKGLGPGLEALGPGLKALGPGLEAQMPGMRSLWHIAS